MSANDCGVYSFTASNGQRRYMVLTADFAARRPWYSLVRTCECGETVSMESGEPREPPKDGSGPGRQWRGLGDAVANAIETATFGLVKPCGGCKDRQEALNRWFPFS